MASRARAHSRLIVASGLIALTGCGGGAVSPTDVWQRTHPIAQDLGPMAPMARANGRAMRSVMRASVRTPDATSLLNWAETAFPSLFAPPQSNRSLDIWTYRYYPATDLYLGVNSNGDVLGLIDKGAGNYQSVSLGTVADYRCQVYPVDCAITPTGAGVAQAYPGDTNIHTDPDVLFAEMGEEATLAELFANWNANSSANSVALDSSTRPAKSPGRQSIRLFTTAGPLGAGTGTVRTAGMYKYFPNANENTVYARWYVKYNTLGTFHHSGSRLGGSNPPSATVTGATAGIRPTGSDFFSLGAELSGAKTKAAQTSTVDFYNYWMHQRDTSYYPGVFYGNSFINAPSVAINLSDWNCIEVQLTLNEPVTSYSGEIAMWINGMEVSRVKSGTLGTWNEDNFQPIANGSPFEGFQWRNDPALRWTYFQILHFVDDDPTGHVNSVNYDHVVVARRYIGPIQ